MTVQEAVRTAVKAAKITQADVSDRCSMSGQGAVSSALQGKSMRAKSLILMLNACGYELVARSIDGKASVQEIVIEDEESAEVTGRYMRSVSDADVPEKQMSMFKPGTVNTFAPEVENLIRRVVREEMVKATPGQG